MVGSILRLFGQRLVARRDSGEPISYNNNNNNNNLYTGSPHHESDIQWGPTQSPQAFWSADGRQERLWGTGILLPQDFFGKTMEAVTELIQSSQSKNFNFFERGSEVKQHYRRKQLKCKRVNLVNLPFGIDQSECCLL